MLLLILEKGQVLALIFTGVLEKRHSHGFGTFLQFHH
jgi:hypothetical protein